MGKLDPDYTLNDLGVHVTDRRVVNAFLRPDATDNHHKSYGFLRTPEFSRVAAGYADAGPIRTDASPDPAGTDPAAVGMAGAEASG